MDRSELTGHTALCLVTLVGFFVYTSSYSLVYHVFKSGATAKPVAVLELWMVFTHLLTSGVTCVVYAVFTIRTADLQTAVFLGVALAVTMCSAACIQDSAQCTIFFPAAAWAPLAAAGAIAWSWIVYIASLGCQSSSVSLGASTTHIMGPIVLAVAAPAIAATLKQTCGIGAQPPVSLGLHLTMLALAFVIWNGSRFLSVGAAPSRVGMRVLASVLVVMDAFLAVQGTAAWLILGLVALALSDGQITDLLFGTGTRRPPSHTPTTGGSGKRQVHLH